jgi:predicted ATP-dependent serine protease
MQITFPANRQRLCYVDTESSDYDYYKVLERMKRQMNVSELPSTFDSFLFREDSHTDIVLMIELYLKQHPDCSILVIDGILDLIADFNNVEQSFHLIQWLKKITKVYNILIFIVLHLGKKEGNTLGHIGSYLDRKSQSVLKIEKNKQQRTIDLTAQFLRSADDIDTISIMHNGYEWIQTTHKTDLQEPIWTKDKIELIDRIIKEPIEFKELIHDLSIVIGKSESTAKKILREWISSGAVVKQGKFYQKK